MLRSVENFDLKQIYRKWSSSKWVLLKKKISVDILVLLVHGIHIK